MFRVLTKTTWVECKLFIREPAAAFFTLLLPVLLLVLNGAANTNAPQADLGGAGAIDILVPGYIALVIATMGIMTLPSQLASYRERGVLRRLHATPVRPEILLVAQLVVHTIVSTLGLAILIGLGMAAFDLNAPQMPAATAVAYLLAVVGFAAFGFVLAALLPSARSVTAVAAALYFPMIFLSGATWPREALPDWAVRLGDVLPLTYVVEAVKDPWIGAGWNVAALALLAAMVVAGTALSSRLFRWE
jgi:ABC-2 type transport system permease protein